jgi:hypothetical protein
MSATAEELPSPAIASIAVAQTVVDQLDRMDPRDAAEIAKAIATVADDPGVPVRIDVPPGATAKDFRALSTSDPDLPVIIYCPGPEPGTWLVVALVDPATYQTYRKGEKQRLLDDPIVQDLIKLGLLTAGLYMLVKATSKTAS